MFEEKAFIIQIPDILLCWYWKNLEDMQLATTGVGGGGVLVALPISSFNSYLLRKKNQNRKALGTCFTNLTFSPQKKNIHIFRQSALKMLMPQFEKKMFKRIGIHPLQLESYPSSGSQCHLLSDVRRQQRHGSSNMSSLHNRF